MGTQQQSLRASRLHRTATALAAAALMMVGGAAGAAQPEQWVKGRVIVETRAGLSDAELAKILKPHGGQAKRMGQSNLFVVQLPGNASETAVAAQLAHNPHLKFAELDGLVKPSLVTNDPYLGSQWHLSKMSALTAWDTTQGNGVTIAIVDSGVEGTHPDLTTRLVPGWNFYGNDSNTSPAHGHGTWVSGAAGATSNNGTGVASVAGQAKLMPLVVTDSTGTAFWSKIASALTYAADRGVRVANISYEKLLNSSSVISAAQYMKSKGGLVVVAAGNNGINENLTPSTSMIVVSATDSSDQKASWSSYGNYVTIAAPGSPIYTTGLGGTYVQGQGTSFSSPLVAATVALMMSANPSLPNTQIESLLYSTAVDLGTAGRDIYFGHGRVNSAAAVQAAVAAVSTADTKAPSAALTSPVANATVTGLVTVDASASDNVGVTKVELRVNGAVVATDTTSPYQFSWDSTKVANGIATLTAAAYDAAGNSTQSAPVSINVSNSVLADTTPPTVAITSPTSSAIKPKGGVTITSSANDNNGAATLKQSLYIDGKLTMTATGGSLAYSWNVNKVSAGSHTITVVAVDAAGNSSSASKQLTK